jgi:hypothetical protein
MSRWWYGLCVAIMVGGPAYGVSQAFALFGDLEHMQRVVMPGSAAVTLPAGESIIYFERESTVDGTVYRVDAAVQFKCHLDGDDGTSLTLDHPSGSTHYSIGAYSGEKLYETSAPHEGTYQLGCSSEATGKFVLAIGQGMGGKIIKLVVVSMGLMLAGGGLTLLVYLRRRAGAEARKAQATPPPTH